MTLAPPTPSLSVDLACPYDLGAQVAPSALRRIADNLLDYAVRHAPNGGQVRVVAESRATSGAHTLTLRVLDDGPGFPKGFLPHAFDRFSRPTEAGPAQTPPPEPGSASPSSSPDRRSGRHCVGRQS